MSGAALLQRARALDAADVLAPLRSRFALPTGEHGQTLAYLCGHSLGLAPLDARRLIEEELDDWARLGVDGRGGDLPAQFTRGPEGHFRGIPQAGPGHQPGRPAHQRQPQGRGQGGTRRTDRAGPRISPVCQRACSSPRRSRAAGMPPACAFFGVAAAGGGGFSGRVSRASRVPSLHRRECGFAQLNCRSRRDVA